MQQIRMSYPPQGRSHTGLPPQFFFKVGHVLRMAGGKEIKLQAAAPRNGRVFKNDELFKKLTKATRIQSITHFSRGRRRLR